jgi:DNA uptake protein ComE-like DNA-binding protein
MSLNRDLKRNSIVAIVFLIVGYQVALFVHRASVLKIIANRDCPDTVYVVKSEEVQRFLEKQNMEKLELADISKPIVEFRKEAEHDTRVKTKRKVENFKFNPNTASSDDFQRLGFTEKQAKSIINYREKGGKFRRKSDFAKSFVVADTVYQRLEPYIVIPKVDINTADSAKLVYLPGIGPWYAKKIIEYREELHGYSYPQQLMDIWNFDAEKYANLEDLIVCSKVTPYPLWELPERELEKHPYIKWFAHDIIVFKHNHSREEWTIQNLIDSNVIRPEYGEKLQRCNIQQP